MSVRKSTAAAAITLIGLLVLAPSAQAGLEPGTPGNDVHLGRDNDNAANSFLQPPGSLPAQHMNNTDVLFGREGDDLLVGNLGDDVLPAGVGNDILVGGPETGTKPGNDVLLGEEGDDIAVWAPGDGNDAYVGDAGTDVLVVAPFQLDAAGSPVLVPVPRVAIGGQRGLDCEIVGVPRAEQLGVPFVVRIIQANVRVATIRVKDVESVLCPNPRLGMATRFDLTAPRPEGSEVAIAGMSDVLGAIVAPPP